MGQGSGLRRVVHLLPRVLHEGQATRASGSGWSTDYPGADNNFSVRLAELTRVPRQLDEDRQPNYVVVRLDDPLLFRCPMLFMEDVGTVGLHRGGSAEAARVSSEGRLPLGGRLLGIVGLAAMGRADRARPAARRISDLRHAADPPDHAHALRREGDSAGAVDQLLAPQRRAIPRSAAPTARRCTSGASRIRTGG